VAPSVASVAGLQAVLAAVVLAIGKGSFVASFLHTCPSLVKRAHLGKHFNLSRYLSE